MFRPLLVSVFGLFVSFSALSTSNVHTTVNFSSIQPADARKDRWNVNTFFNSIQVIDGNLTFWVIKDVNCTDDCKYEVFPGDGSNNLSTIKEVTGVDIGVITIGSGLDTLIRIRKSIYEGSYSGGRVVLNYNDLNRQNTYGVLFSVQSRTSPAWQLQGDATVLREWFDAGLRILQLQYGPSEKHDVSERLGYGTSEGDEKGLTKLGKAVVKEMNALGMVIDVAHSNRQTTLDAAALSTLPIISTHSNAEALTPHSRNKSDEELLAIANSDGVICVTTIRWMLDTNSDTKAELEDFILHVEYMVELVGIDHVGIATDAYMNGWQISSTHYSCKELASFERWKILAQQLHDKGWSNEHLEKLLGGNLKRVFLGKKTSK